jgi:hypothetical protein
VKVQSPKLIFSLFTLTFDFCLLTSVVYLSFGFLYLKFFTVLLCLIVKKLSEYLSPLRRHITGL